MLSIDDEDVALGDDLERSMGFVDSEVDGPVVEIVASLSRRARTGRDPDRVGQAHLGPPVLGREVRLMVRRGHGLTVLVDGSVNDVHLHAEKTAWLK